MKGYLSIKKTKPNYDGAEAVLGTVALFNDLKNAKAEVSTTLNLKIAQLEQLETRIQRESNKNSQIVRDAVTEFETIAVQLITDIKSLPHLQGERGQAAEIDEHAIIQSILSQIEPPTIDENALVKKVIAKIPESKADLKIINENLDPEIVVEKILELVKEGKFKLPHEGIIGTETAMESYLRKYGYKPYIHGGGDTVAAGTNITITTNSSGAKVINASGGSGSGYQLPTGTVNGSNTAFVFATAPAAIVVDGLTFQKTQQDGTVNWTGTTNVSLTVAPNFSIFAVA